MRVTTATLFAALFLVFGSGVTYLVSDKIAFDGSGRIELSDAIWKVGDALLGSAGVMALLLLVLVLVPAGAEHDA